MKKNLMMDIVGFTIVSFFIGCTIFLFAVRGTSPKAEEELDFRIELIEEGSIDKYYNYKIVVDRETDVEYLIVQKPGDGVGVTIMRDSGGMVKLRE